MKNRFKPRQTHTNPHKDVFSHNPGDEISQDNPSFRIERNRKCVPAPTTRSALLPACGMLLRVGVGYFVTQTPLTNGQNLVNSNFGQRFPLIFHHFLALDQYSSRQQHLTGKAKRTLNLRRLSAHVPFAHSLQTTLTRNKTKGEEKSFQICYCIHTNL